MTNSNVSQMIMYEDNSVYVRYSDGSKLHISPCGCEFVTVKAPDPSAHPLQATVHVRQRTRFAISTYKEMLEEALVFRNKYAPRPYLPNERIPAVHRKPFFSLDSEVEWPCMASCDAKQGPRGETIVRSVEGMATLTLSSSGEDFAVEFTCSISQAQNKPLVTQSLSQDDASSPINQQQYQKTSDRGEVRLQSVSDVTNQELVQERRMKMRRSRSCSPQNNSCSTVTQPQPEEMYQCTAVVQHHSCSSVAPMWQYPLSVARHYWAMQRGTTPEEENATIKLTDTNREERLCGLPEALPLGCPSPHQHRWKVKDPLAQGEESPGQDFPGELVKVMWCQGVIYRILSSSIPVIEVSPSDGSVIRSNNILSSYFTHFRDDSQSGGKIKEIRYHVNSLPPDVPGQLYSVGSVVSRASRILTCYNQARNSLVLPATPCCLEQEKNHFEPMLLEEKLPCPVSVDSHLIVTQTEQSRSDIVSAELEKIKRFNFLLENSNLLSVQEGSPELAGVSAAQSEIVDDVCIAEAIQRTSKAINDIDAVIAAAKLT